MRSAGHGGAICVTVLLALGACQAPDALDPPLDTVTPTARPFQVSLESGPFDGLRWSGRPVETGSLLHDDGARLWSIDLSGRRRLVWRHPEARVVQLAASEGGRRLAIGLAATDPRINVSDTSAFLYSLDPDGRVRLVDVVDDFRSLDTPLFLRPPTESTETTERLYWLRVGEGVGSDGRIQTQVMVESAAGPRPVRVPLRFTEGVVDIDAYPGSDTFTLSLFRQNDVPTRFEILRNDDRSGSADASVTLWGTNESRAQTDVPIGVAWVSPTDYVVPVAHEFFPDDYALRLFRTTCESEGSARVYRGTAIDWGFAETPWRLLPAGPHHVLVLGAHDVRSVFEGRATGIFWRLLDLRTGRIASTRIAWNVDEQAWAWVVEPGDRLPEPGCGDTRWTWP
ncbi:MAG: hypothetical protein WEA10_10975 [Actinomycetota bacterium]